MQNKKCVTPTFFFSTKGHTVWHQRFYSIMFSNENAVQSPVCYRTHPCVQMQFGMTLKNEEFACTGWAFVHRPASHFGELRLKNGTCGQDSVRNLVHFQKPDVFFFPPTCADFQKPMCELIKPDIIYYLLLIFQFTSHSFHIQNAPRGFGVHSSQRVFEWPKDSDRAGKWTGQVKRTIRYFRYYHDFTHLYHWFITHCTIM